MGSPFLCLENEAITRITYIIIVNLKPISYAGAISHEI